MKARRQPDWLVGKEGRESQKPDQSQKPEASQKPNTQQVAELEIELLAKWQRLGSFGTIQLALSLLLRDWKKQPAKPPKRKRK